MKNLLDILRHQDVDQLLALRISPFYLSNETLQQHQYSLLWPSLTRDYVFRVGVPFARIQDWTTMSLSSMFYCVN